jgi:hypothetical protein
MAPRYDHQLGRLAGATTLVLQRVSPIYTPIMQNAAPSIKSSQSLVLVPSAASKLMRILEEKVL